MLCLFMIVNYLRTPFRLMELEYKIYGDKYNQLINFISSLKENSDKDCIGIQYYYEDKKQMLKITTNKYDAIKGVESETYNAEDYLEQTNVGLSYNKLSNYMKKLHIEQIVCTNDYISLTRWAFFKAARLFVYTNNIDNYDNDIYYYKLVDKNCYIVDIRY